MKKLKKEYLKNSYLKEYPLEGFLDTHIHTAPDFRHRILNDVEAALDAKSQKMRAIVLKSHIESTVGRAKIAEYVSGIKVFGGACLNTNVGGLNPEAVKTTAELGGKIVWFPTISSSKIKITSENLEEILHLAIQNDLILATGHMSIDDIFLLLDMANSLGVWKIIINHPLTKVVNATIDQQKEMSRYGYLEHCFVACMKQHDNLNPKIIADAINVVRPERCIMATDFGQAHNSRPVDGMKMFVDSMMGFGISWEQISMMCIENPYKLLF
ncbi:MAG: hypothetical protein FJ150_06130 [Euryarchaeota archaeon]|nr:hypothetical protein [Euryarchaeota archaeon]